MHRGLEGGRECSICPWVNEGRIVTAKDSQYRKEITAHLSCQSRNIIYIIMCTKCKVQYIGETDRTLRDRISEHKGYVRTKKLNQATGAQFNQPGHSVTDMSVMAIEKIFDRGTPFRKEMEKEYISNFNTFHNGLNKTPGG